MRASRRRIALNAQLLKLNAGYRSAGIARYILNLLCVLPGAAPDFELHTFTGESLSRSMLQAQQLHLTRWPTRSPLARILWEQLIWPFLLVGRPFALVHSLAFVSPVANPFPSVVTVYDLSFALYPEYFRPLNRLYLQWGTRRSVARARRVIAISENTRRDLIRLFGVPADKIDVVLPGVEPEFFSDDANPRLVPAERSRLPEHFLLFVGTIEPRKNIPSLIRAFMRARAQAHLSHKLVIIGGRGWKDVGVARALADTDARDTVIFKGYVPQEELISWYRAADAFVYPSQYEGFGMPLLEALAAGAPVITSNLSSPPEAVGDAALLVNPGDENELEAAIVRVLTDETLRHELREKGPARARTFTWERAAATTAGVYRRALEPDSANHRQELH